MDSAPRQIPLGSEGENSDVGLFGNVHASGEQTSYAECENEGDVFLRRVGSQKLEGQLRDQRELELEATTELAPHKKNVSAVRRND